MVVVDAQEEHPTRPLMALNSSLITRILCLNLLPTNRRIHDNPELGCHEFIAHDTLCTFLEAQEGWKVLQRVGFQVTRSAHGIGTAFIAKYGNGSPVVSFIAEYDRLPDIGHACGHNLFATSSLAGALATAAVVKKWAISGKVILFGTLAEEGGGGKIKLLEAGAYIDKLVNFIRNSFDAGEVADIAVVTTCAYHRFKVEYFGKEAHTAAAPREGINPLDGLIKAMGHIISGGLAPNVIHEYTAGVFIIRAKLKCRLVELEKVCARVVAASSGAKLIITSTTRYTDHTPNYTMARYYQHYFNRLTGQNTVPISEFDVIRGATNASMDQETSAMCCRHPRLASRSHQRRRTPELAAAAGT
ncbi:hypothetical protein FISHEDRAFT_71214 [Fistulina hepatica ATCC 64428]|nr:hypothetical protein FISHEDRAFT_71214 [Fistulina hepatica ATCC 64428]